MSGLDIQTLILGWMALCALVAAVTGTLGVYRGLRKPPRSAEAVEPAPERKPAAPSKAVEAIDLRRSLAKTRAAFAARLQSLLGGQRELDAATVEELESVLFGADLGVRTAQDLLEAARAVASVGDVREALQQRALEILRQVPLPEARELRKPYVVLVIGVNGSGKTTSIGKLAARWSRQGLRVLVAAADTFRAAAIDQLEVWAERADAELVKGTPGGDPAAVAFDAVKAARARDVDVVIIDTAGRLHTQAGLMDELGKISRVVKKELPDAPHEVVLVLDSTTGQNAIRQAQEFTRAVQVSHILLSKLDGSAKGGVVLGIAQEVGIPVRYVGVGEGIEDLQEFEPEVFVRALFGWEGEPGA